MDRLAIAAAILAVLSLSQEQIYGDGECDIFHGSWVYDESYPLYQTPNCPFIEKQFDCLRNGRPDHDYLKFRWQPTACNLPPFVTENWREEHYVRWGFPESESMAIVDLHAPHYCPTGTVQIYDCSGPLHFHISRVRWKVMFSRNAFLVDLVSTPTGRVMKLDSIEGGKLWKGVDYLIFYTWHWWLHTGRKQPWDFIEEGNHTQRDMDRLVAYEKGLKTWAKWVDANVDPSKTRVFFQGVSPDHMNSSDWGEPSAKNCEGQKKPMRGGSYPGGRHPAEQVVEKVISTMSKPVYLLNITTLSQLRKDGHPSVFGHGGHRDMDCSHWCLAGVPDTWNLLLYAALIQS